MKFNLFPFQEKARKRLRKCVYRAQIDYSTDEEQQVISFTAPTGAGKTIMLASFVENVYIGDEYYPAQPNAVFVWLSDSPELNKQSLDKFYFNSDIVDHSQLVMIEDESFNQRILDDGKIYFLNTQKLGKSSNLTKHSDSRQFTIWETLQSTIREKSDRLYFIIDEAHRGMKGISAGRATTIMQKFLKGSAEDGLSPAPLVIGMSATPERFNALVAGISSSIQTVVVTAEEVKASGLLKDRIIVIHPDETTSSSITKDMAMLEAASDEWKNKCEHWAQYCREQHKKLFNPIFVIQVMNGTGDKISDTDLDECLKKIIARTGFNFEVGEVIHTFQTNTDLTINNFRVIYREPSQIAGDDKIKIVFFKENLSTGWDCPQAETMMSFRKARDATYIAQLLGRMIRTPLQSHIEVDDTLNDVRLYLPYFDKETVQDIINELQSAEGGNIPTDIVSESNGERAIETWSVNPKKNSTTASSQSNSAFRGITNRSETTQTTLDADESFPTETENITHSIHTEDISDFMIRSEKKLELIDEVFAKNEFVDVVKPDFDRKKIVNAINEMGLLTYHIRSIRNNDYLKSLLNMAHFLTRSFLDRDALKNTRNEIINLIHDYIEELKKVGKYETLQRKAKEFKLSAQIFDVFGQTVKSMIGQTMFVTTDADIERQFSIAESKLKSDGIATAYLDKFCVDYDFIDGYMIDVILFVANNECMVQLEKYSEKRFHELNDTHRRRIAKSSARIKKEYDGIVSDGDKISKHNFTLPETISVTPDNDGKEYPDHLFVDDTGRAKIKLNTWEEGVLHEEQRHSDFVCWIRNPQRKSWSLCIPYQKEDNSIHEMYPDLLIIRHDELGYIADILEPHDPDRRDNIGKARGFADYAKNNTDVGRLQLIREVNKTGRKYFSRLDMSKSKIRDRVCRASTNNEIDSIFEEYGTTDTQN